MSLEPVLKKLERILPIILVFGHIFLGPFRALLTQGRTMLSWGSDQTVIVYVPRACIKKNLEWISLIILVLGPIFLDFGHFEPHLALFEPPDTVQA